MHYHRKAFSQARKAWQTSLQRNPSAWALRNLAVLSSDEGHLDQAVDLYTQAFDLFPNLLPLAVEYCRSLVEAQRQEEALQFIAGLPVGFRDHGRFRALEAWAAMESGDLRRAELILDGKLEMAGLREGEIILSELWYSLQERRLSKATGLAVDEKIKARVRRECVLPQHIDFRMLQEIKCV